MKIKLPQLEATVDPAGLGTQAGAWFVITVIWIAIESAPAH